MEPGVRPSPGDPVDDREAQPGHPFEAEPRNTGGTGCGRYVLIGCGGMIVLVAIALLIAVLRARDLVVWSLGALQAQVEAALPDDVSAVDRERLDLAFESALRAIEAGAVEPAAMRELQSALLRFAGTPPANLTREDILDLTRVLEKVGGLDPPRQEDGPPDPEEDPAAPLTALIPPPWAAVHA